MIFSRIHQFAPAGAGAATVHAAAPDSNADDIHDSFFDALRAAFHGNARRQHGRFDDAAHSALRAGIADYCARTIAAEDLGRRLVDAFGASLADGALQQPWYLWLIVDGSGSTEFVYVFLLAHDETYRVSAQQTVVRDGAVRLDKLQYAAKVNVAEWQAGAETCVTCLAPRSQQPLAQAWKALIGFAEQAGRAEKTEALLAAVDRYADNLPDEKEHECRARVAEYCLEQDRAGAPVEIGELSRHVDEAAPDALLDFLAQHMEEAATPLYADRRQLKRYTRLFGRDNDLSIGFSTQMLGSHILYDEAAGTLTIRSIPKSLKSQLARHMKKAE